MPLAPSGTRLAAYTPMDLLDSPPKAIPDRAGGARACSKARWFGLWAVVSLALGCGRSSLLADDLSGPLGDDAGKGTPGGQKGHSGDDATVPGGDDAATTTSREDSSTSPLVGDGDVTGDGDADADGGAVGYLPDGGCAPNNCWGCCRDDGFCVVPNGSTQTPLFCGLGGRRCLSCGPGDGCIVVLETGTAACFHPQATCDPSNCEGCCDGLSIHGCILVGSDDECGHGGQPCSTCLANEQCRVLPSGGGSCQVNEPCGPGTCDGCCEGDVCAEGDQPVACGFAGAACQSCADAGRCVANACDYGPPLGQ
jgi:hypothetical protein